MAALVMEQKMKKLELDLQQKSQIIDNLHQALQSKTHTIALIRKRNELDDKNQSYDIEQLVETQLATLIDEISTKQRRDAQKIVETRMRQLEQEKKELQDQLRTRSTLGSTSKEHHMHGAEDSRNRVEILDTLKKMKEERNKLKEEKEELLASDRINQKEREYLKDRIRALERDDVEQKHRFENEMSKIRALAKSNSEEQQRLESQMRVILKNANEEKQHLTDQMRWIEERNNEENQAQRDHTRTLIRENTQLHINIQILKSSIDEQFKALEEARAQLAESVVSDKRDDVGGANDVRNSGSAALLDAEEIEALTAQNALMMIQTEALMDANTESRVYCGEAEKREVALNKRIRDLETNMKDRTDARCRLATAETELVAARAEHLKCVERITELNESHEALLSQFTELEEEVEQLRHHLVVLEAEKAQTLAEKQNVNALAADLHQQKVLALLEEKEKDKKLAHQQLESQVEQYVSKIYELEEANDRFICRIEMLEHELNERDGNNRESTFCKKDERKDDAENLNNATRGNDKADEQSELLHRAGVDEDSAPTSVIARTLREESQFAFDQMVQRIAQVRTDAAAEVSAMKEAKELGIMAIKRELHRVESGKDADILKISVLSSERDEANKRIKELLDDQRAQKQEIACCRATLEAEAGRLTNARMQLFHNALRMVTARMVSYLTRQAWVALVKARNITEVAENVDEENEEEEVETYGADPVSEEQWSIMVSSGRLSAQMTCLHQSTNNLNACGRDMSNTLNDFCRSLEMVRFSFPEQWNSSSHFRRFVSKLRGCAKKVMNNASVICALSERSLVPLDTLRGAVTERIFAPRLRRLDHIPLHAGFTAIKQHQVSSLKETNAIALDRFAEEEATINELLRGSTGAVCRAATSERDVFAGQPKSMREVHILLDSIAERATLKAIGKADPSGSALENDISKQHSVSVSDPGTLLCTNESDAPGKRPLLDFTPPVRVDTMEQASTLNNNKKQPASTVGEGNIGECDDDSNSVAAMAAVTERKTESVEKDQIQSVAVGKRPSAFLADGPSASESDGRSLSVGKGLSASLSKGPSASQSKGPPAPAGKGPLPLGSKGPPVPEGKGPQLPASKGPPVPEGKGPQLPASKGPPVPKGKGPLPLTKGPSVPGGKGPPLPGSKGSPGLDTKGKSGKEKGKGVPAADPGPKPPDDVVGKKFLWSSLASTRYANSIFEQIQKANASAKEVKALTQAEIDAIELCNAPSRAAATPTEKKSVVKIKVNFDTLTRLFFEKKEEAVAPVAKAPVSRRSSVLSVLEPKRGGNAEIFMSGRNVTLEKVQRAVTDLDVQALPVDALQEVLALYPNPEEAETLKGASISTMPRGEVFLHGLMDIPNFKDRALACIIRGTFSQAVREISEQFETLYSCCSRILDSSGVVSIFSIILQTGNFLNYGSNKGAQLGFALDTLSQLSRVASSVEKNVSLIHFVAETAWCESRESLKAALDDLAGCLDASKVDFADACFRLNDVDKDIGRVETILEKMKTPASESSTESRFFIMMQSFVQEGRAQLAQLQERRVALETLIARVTRTFGERVGTPIGESLEKLGLFKCDLQNALNANHERELKRKTRLAKEKNNAADRKKREERRAARSQSML